MKLFLKTGLVSALLFLSGSATCGTWEYSNEQFGKLPLCQELLERLNKLAPKYRPQDDLREVFETYPGFTSPPWQDLDPYKHIDLLAKLAKYWRVGPNAYFCKDAPPGCIPNEGYRDIAMSYITGWKDRSAYRFRVWRSKDTNFFWHIGNEKRPHPIGSEQTFVQAGLVEKGLSYRYHLPIVISGGIISIVTSNLYEPDPDINASTNGIVSNSNLALYKDEPILIQPPTIWHSTDGELRPYCDFDYHSKDEK